MQLLPYTLLNVLKSYTFSLYTSGEISMRPASPKPLFNSCVRKTSAAGAFVVLSLSSFAFGIGIAQAQLGTDDSLPLPPGSGSQAFRPIETLDDFLNLGTLGDSPPPPPGGTRGNICAISPGAFATDLIWSDRPVFVWYGRADELYVQEYQPFENTNDDQRLWTLDLTPFNSSAYGLTYMLPYEGEPLTSGVLYEWVLADTDEEGLYVDENSYIFEIIDGEPRMVIDQALGEISSGELSPQALAWEQAKVFFEADLLSDAIEVLYERDLLSAAFVADACGLTPETE